MYVYCICIVFSDSSSLLLRTDINIILLEMFVVCCKLTKKARRVVELFLIS